MDFTEKELLEFLKQPEIRLFWSVVGDEYVTSHVLVNVILKLKKGIECLSDGIVKASEDAVKIMEEDF